MASYVVVDHTWTKRRMTAECHNRGLRCFARLNKDQLISFLNIDADGARIRASQAGGDSGLAATASGRAAGDSNDPPGYRSEIPGHSSGTLGSSDPLPTISEEGRRIDDSWTVRALKAECGRRGLRRFAGLTKPDLLALLLRGSPVSVAPPESPRGGDGSTTWRRRVSDLKESADNALTSNQFTAALELSSQAIGLVEDQGLVRTADPWNSQTKALLLANRAEARATLGITVEATRDCVEGLRLKPDLWKTLLLKARLHMRMCEWELAIQGFQAYLNTVGICEVSRREATVELEQCRRTQMRTFDQQLGRMEAMLRGLQAEASRRDGGTSATPELARSGTAVNAETSERVRAAATGARVFGFAASEASRVHSGATPGSSSSDLNPAQAAVPRALESVTSAAPAPERNGGNGGSCVVCMDNTVSSTFVPCGHFCCCDACADRVDACPVCRTDVERIVRTFIP